MTEVKISDILLLIRLPNLTIETQIWRLIGSNSLQNNDILLYNLAIFSFAEHIFLIGKHEIIFRKIKSFRH